MAFLRGLFWFALFIVFTFCFVVLFEYGPRDFASGDQKEYPRVKTVVVKQTEKIGKPKKKQENLLRFQSARVAGPDLPRENSYLLWERSRLVRRFRIQPIVG